MRLFKNLWMNGVCLVNSLRRISSSPVLDSKTEKNTRLAILLSVVSILVMVIKAPDGTSTSRAIIFDSSSLRSSFNFSSRFANVVKICKLNAQQILLQH